MSGLRYAEGSPPQVRGKRVDTQDSAQAIGITPAGAGKTPESYTKSSTHWDHPRRCGENQTTDRGKGQFAGSPPQVRGKPSFAAASPSVTRITPAGAGKTDWR